MFIAESGPVPISDGKRQRTYALLEALAEKYEVDYLLIGDKKDYDHVVRNNPFPLVRFYFAKSDARSLRVRLLNKIGFRYYGDSGIRLTIIDLNASRSYSFVFTRYLKPAMYAPDGFRMVSDVDDDFVETINTKLKEEQSFFRKIRLWMIFSLNIISYRRLMKRPEKLLFVKESDLEDSRSFLVPNLPFQILKPGPPPFQSCEEQRILFVGKLSYKPNETGLAKFLLNVWPGILSELNHVQLTVVSSVMPNARLKSIIEQAKNVELKVNVENLNEVYSSHALVVAPIYNGGGANIKVIESLVFGRPVVTTIFGSRGFEVATEKGWIATARNEAEFGQQVIRILLLKSLAALQSELYDWACQNISLRQWRKNFIETLSKF